MKNRFLSDPTRTLAALAVAGCLMAPSASAQFAPASRDLCSTGEPESRVAACTQQLAQRQLDNAAKLAAYVSRAAAQEALGQVELALQDLQSALDLDPSSALALRTRAVVLQRHGRSTDAVADLSRAIAAHPQDLSLFKVRGGIYANIGQAGRAVEDFSKVLDVAPTDLQARQSRGLVLAAAGAHQRAVADFTRILSRDPRVRVARAARAFSLFHMKQYRLAIQDWDQLLQEDPAQPAIVYCRGAAKVLSGDETGRADIDAVRQQTPDVAAAEATACPIP